jgi:hypothetical protein
MRLESRAALFAALLFTTALAAAMPAAPTDTMPAALAREVADRTIELVESRALYPREQAEYAQARATLLAAFEGQPAQIERKELYARIRKLLATLDTNQHSFLIPAGTQLTAPRKQAARDDLPPPTFQLLKTGNGTVLRWTPPPVVGGGAAAVAPYLKRFHDEAAAMPETAQACALVLDLSEQTGGNAWPPLVAMHPLFGDANKANWVDRDGRRKPVVDRAALEKMTREPGDGRANPLARFGNGPLAVVSDRRTASAGEMLLVALLGEPRVQTFGNTSAGKSTGNVTYTLADGSTLILTQTRYALGDGPVYRGGIAPMHPIAPSETLKDALTAAAQWAAENSPDCRAAGLARSNHHQSEKNI